MQVLTLGLQRFAGLRRAFCHDPASLESEAAREDATLSERRLLRG